MIPFGHRAGLAATARIVHVARTDGGAASMRNGTAYLLEILQKLYVLLWEMR